MRRTSIELLVIDRFIFIGSRGAKSAYTADEFRRLFRHGFGQDFLNEKTLNRTVETFLDEQEQSFTLFEYAVELIDEVRLFFDATLLLTLPSRSIVCVKISLNNENTFRIFSPTIISIAW